jgi:hypothetical protein
LVVAFLAGERLFVADLGDCQSGTVLIGSLDKQLPENAGVVFGSRQLGLVACVFDSRRRCPVDQQEGWLAHGEGRPSPTQWIARPT